jgi:DNA-directed RNA polymerase subunit omega
MILQSTDELEDYIGNKYSLVIVAAKRARQIKEGHTPLSRDSSPNPLSIALREVQEQKLQSIAPPEEELAPAPRDVIASLVAGAGFDLDEDLDLEDSDAVDDLAALLIGADEEEEEEAEESDSDDPLVTATATDSDEEAEESEEESDDEVPLEEAEESDEEDEEEA